MNEADGSWNKNMNSGVMGDDEGRTQISPGSFREMLGHYSSGINIIAGRNGDELVGFTCQSFMSVSLHPPLIAFCVNKASASYPKIRNSASFSVNVLSHQQIEFSRQFARKSESRWVGVEWSETLRKNPVLKDSLLWLDCEIASEFEAGDHLIVVGLVLDGSTTMKEEHEPLVYFRGKYRKLKNEASDQ